MHFISEHRKVYGVEPICKVLPIAPSTYYEQYNTGVTSGKCLDIPVRRDAFLRDEIKRVWDENFEVYGARKVWRELNREGIEVARCTVGNVNRNSQYLGK